MTPDPDTVLSAESGERERAVAALREIGEVRHATPGDECLWCLGDLGEHAEWCAATIARDALGDLGEPESPGLDVERLQNAIIAVLGWQRIASGALAAPAIAAEYVRSVTQGSRSHDG